MRRLITTVMCLVAIAAFAQEKADIKVSYRYEQPNFKTGVRDTKYDYILLANGKTSKFYSPKTEYVDSMQSTPEGMAKLNEIAKSAITSGKMEDIPRPEGTFYLVKSMTDGKVLAYELVGMNKLFSEDDIPQIDWEISDSTKYVLGYECNLATAKLYGRKWRAWFASEIPVTNGPWKLSGLPGLILEAETEDGLYYFVATGLQQTRQPISPVYLSDRYENVSRKELLKSKRAFIDNPLGNINSQLGGKDAKLVIQDENGNAISGNQRLFAPREEVDFIETDY